MAGTVSVSASVDQNKGLAVLTAAWVADKTTATVPDTDLPSNFIELIKGWYLYAVDTKPGEDDEAPTADYDVTLEDDYGFDILGGAGGDRSATTAERVMPLWGNNPLPAPIYGALILKIANNSVNSATGTVRMIFTARGK